MIHIKTADQRYSDWLKEGRTTTLDRDQLYEQFMKGEIRELRAAMQSQAQQEPEYTFEELTKLVLQAATKEGHKVTMKIKWAEEKTIGEKINFSDEVNWSESVISPAPEGDKP